MLWTSVIICFFLWYVGEGKSSKTRILERIVSVYLEFNLFVPEQREILWGNILTQDTLLALCKCCQPLSAKVFCTGKKCPLPQQSISCVCRQGVWMFEGLCPSQGKSLMFLVDASLPNCPHGLCSASPFTCFQRSLMAVISESLYILFTSVPMKKKKKSLVCFSLLSHIMK